MRELIIQYNQHRAFDLFEYTKEKELILLLHSQYLANIVSYINECGGGLCIWVEFTPDYYYLTKILQANNNGNIIGRKFDAELFHTDRKIKHLPPMEYIAYWQMIKPESYDTILSEA